MDLARRPSRSVLVRRWNLPDEGNEGHGRSPRRLAQDETDRVELPSERNPFVHHGFDGLVGDDRQLNELVSDSHPRSLSRIQLAQRVRVVRTLTNATRANGQFYIGQFCSQCAYAVQLASAWQAVCAWAKHACAGMRPLRQVIHPADGWFEGLAQMSPDPPHWLWQGAVAAHAQPKMYALTRNW